MRQVIHALLTRPPLSHRTIIPEGNQVKCFVRLACVKHAASVHPEPGSNSHVKKLIPGPDYLAWLIYPKPSLLGFCSEFSQKSKGLNQTFYFLNFQGLCIIQSLILKVHRNLRFATQKEGFEPSRRY